MVSGNIKKYLGFALLVIFVGVLVGYTYNRASDLIHGPRIVISLPQNGATFTHSFITLTGSAHNISKITLNDLPIFALEDGTFQEKLLLAEGYNKLTLSAEDRFGRIKENVLELVYK